MFSFIFSREDLLKLDKKTRVSVISEIGHKGDTVKTMTRKGVREHFSTLKETEVGLNFWCKYF